MNAFMALEAKRKEVFSKQVEVNNQRDQITVEMNRVQQEMEGVRPESTRLSQKLNTYSSKSIQLYTQCSSLDHELVILLSKKSVLERNSVKGQDEIAEANKSWDQLYSLLENASRPTTVETGEASQHHS